MAESLRTFGAFLFEDLPDARGAGAVFLPDFGGYRSLRQKTSAKVRRDDFKPLEKAFPQFLVAKKRLMLPH